MEKLAYMVLLIGLLGLGAMGLGGWMIHTGLNASDTYKTIGGFLALGVGGWFAALCLGGMAMSR
ncbi:MAG: hypothetical protein EOP83_33705 [Verrucomicrobiaceae bacterium]|nr:MAG: hypothetical protein EOP83_33705 [Verrucomicrobiaceae bacterium]